MKIKSILSDNDGTMYPIFGEFPLPTVDNIIRYVSDKLDMPEEEVRKERKKLFQKYGLECSEFVFMKEYDLDSAELIKQAYLSCDFDGVFKKDERLCQMLKRIDIPKSILTSNPSQFARKILSRLGIEDQFEKVIGSIELEYCLKPKEEAFMRAFEMTGYEPETTVFIDDLAENVIAAKNLGMVSVFINPNGNACPEADYTIRKIYELEEILR